MKFLDLKYNAFGLDINDSSIKIAKLEKNGGKFSVSSYGITELKPGIVESGVIKNEKALADAIKSACENVKRKKIKVKYVFISLPEEESFLQVIQMPKMDVKELKTAVIFEAENYIPLPIEQVYLDFQTITPMKDGLDHIDLLVAATPRKVVDSYINCVKLAGFTPICAEVESQSTVRALIKNEISDNPVILIDMGKNNIDFIVFSGQSIRFTYSIPISQNKLTQAISENMKISVAEAEKLKIKYGLSGFEEKEKTDKEAKIVFQAMSPVLEDLVAQIKKYIDFYQEHASHEHLSGDTKIKKIIFGGGGADLKEMTGFFTKKIGIEAEVGNPFINAPLKKNDEKIDYLSLTTALGLALGAINIEKENK
jgi:type IV pilus assembly protein PilM